MPSIINDFENAELYTTSGSGIIVQDGEAQLEFLTVSMSVKFDGSSSLEMSTPSARINTADEIHDFDVSFKLYTSGSSKNKQPNTIFTVVSPDQTVLSIPALFALYRTDSGSAQLHHQINEPSPAWTYKDVFYTGSIIEDNTWTDIRLVGTQKSLTLHNPLYKIDYYQNGVYATSIDNIKLLVPSASTNTFANGFSVGNLPNIGSPWLWEPDFRINPNSQVANFIGTWKNTVGGNSGSLTWDNFYEDASYVTQSVVDGLVVRVKIFNTPTSSIFFSTGTSVYVTAIESGHIGYSSGSPSVYKISGDILRSDVKSLYNLTTIGTGSNVNRTFQLSNDGSTWKYFNSSWITGSTVSESNSESEINTQLLSYVPSEKLYIKTFLVSDGTYQTSIDQLKMNYDINVTISNGSKVKKNLKLTHL